MERFAGLDIGGTWLKGSLYASCSRPVIDVADVAASVTPQTVCRVRSRLGSKTRVESFIESLDEIFALLLPKGGCISGIGVSTAGIVDYAGKNLLVAANHLGPIGSPAWREYLEEKYGVPVVLINDADAAAIGAAAAGYLRGDKTIGVMPIGTGVGFSLWRNGRRWRPGGILPLLGAVEAPCGSFDSTGGTTVLAEKAGHDLSAIFGDEKFLRERERYISGLANVIHTACVIYRTDRILIGGGLASAVSSCGYPLGETLTARMAESLTSLGYRADVDVMPEGNSLSLAGAIALAAGESAARKKGRRKEYVAINTETPYDPDIALHRMDSEDIVELLWRVEQEAGEILKDSLGRISLAARTVARKLSEGGRLIYVGAGTSGRLAATDAVELGCTFGLPRDRVLTLIAGGIADASIEIENNFEEDASAVPEMLLASIDEKDVVVGISVSGSAWYVRSALAFARAAGACTVFIEESPAGDDPLADIDIFLGSGHEVVAGSTRMKAGTATKKVLNFLSTTAMILLGNVYGPYMIGVECVNEKLILRAQTILCRLFGMPPGEAKKHLAENGNDLRVAIEHFAADQKINFQHILM